MLIIFGGLPGSGKTTVARELARQIDAVYLRIDSVEQAIRASGLSSQSMNDAGYHVAYAIAGDNLRIGRTVIADSVNPLQLTRDAWIKVANSVPVGFLEVEFKCTDAREHRRRVEERPADLPGLKPPSWEEVCAREYHSWNREHLVIDTAGRTEEQNVMTIREFLEKLPRDNLGRPRAEPE